MANFDCTTGKKGFTLDEIKEFLSKNDNEKSDLIMKLYFQCLLKTEIILADSKDDSNNILKKFFYLDNKQISFNKFCFLNFNSNKIEILDENESFYHRRLDNQNDCYYSTEKKCWYFDYKNDYSQKLEVDELYYKTKTPKKAKDIYVSSKDSYSIKDNKTKNKDFFKNNLKNDFPIAIRYRYKVFEKNSIILFKDNKNCIRCVRDLTEKEKELYSLTQHMNSSLVYRNKEKIKEKNLDTSFKKIKLTNEHFYYKNNKIDATCLYHLEDNSPKDRDITNIKENQVYYNHKKEVYTFKKTLIYTDTIDNKIKAIPLKKENKFFDNHIKVFNIKEQSLISKEYNMKLSKYPGKSIINHKYIILYKDVVNENKLDNDNFLQSHDIHIKYFESINDISVSIFQKDKELKEMTLNSNTTLMHDTEKTAKLYWKILYRFRNSIAHGEFKIIENEIIFCNTYTNPKNKKIVTLRARLDINKLDNFLDILL